MSFNHPITKDNLDLYGSYESIPELSRLFIENAIMSDNYEELYNSIRQMEIDNKDVLVSLQDQYPEVLKPDNVDAILETIKNKQSSKKS